jgi:hypothetical protein
MTGHNVALERFQIVAGALLQRNKLFINYHGRGNDESSQRETPRDASRIIATTGISTLGATAATPCASLIPTRANW